jgi:hypothetical protein
MAVVAPCGIVNARDVSRYGKRVSQCVAVSRADIRSVSGQLVFLEKDRSLPQVVPAVRLSRRPM